jgi:hypothetical protein
LEANKAGLVAAGFAISVEKKSIHGVESIQFMDKVVGAASWQLGVMYNGLTPEFQSEPSKNKEKNNPSVLNESVVQDKI